MSLGRWFLAVTLAAGVLAGGMVPDAEAKKKPKQSMSAKVDGKLVKGKTVVVAYLAGVRTGATGGATPKSLRIGTPIRTIQFLCGVDMKTLTPPVTLASGECGGQYNETKLGVPGRKSWQSSSFSVTVTSIAGTRVKGSFEGTLPPTPDHAGDKTHVITKGKFSIVLPGAGA